MRKKVISVSEAVNMIPDGATIMIGGFMAVGTPPSLIDGLAAKGVKNLTVISNDTGFPNVGVGKLIVNKQIKRLYASHVGTNPETGRQINAKEIEAILMPQGTLAERIRAAGAGLGGILTPTGLGTVVQEGKQIIEIEGRPYLLELPLRAQFALLHAYKADLAGNLVYKGTMRNFNPVMAMAADIVIAEVDELVEDGYLDPEIVMTPGIFIDYLVKRVN
jgi:acetate CoA/acetoacetate CoA-transferase alpha subunit